MNLIPQNGESATAISMDRKALVSMYILISSLMVTGLLYHILRAGFGEELSSSAGIVLFVVFAIIPYLSGYVVFRKFVTPITQSLGTHTSTPYYLRLSYQMLKVALVINGAMLALIIIQVVTASQFNLALTVIALQPNAALVVVLFSYLGRKFLSWFRTGHDFATLFLGLAFLCVTVGTALSDAVNTTAFLLDDLSRTEILDPSVFSGNAGDADEVSANLKSNGWLHALFLIIQFPLRIAFVLYWIATVMLLRKYSSNIGKGLFWTIASLPMAVFVVASILIYGGVGSLMFRGVLSSGSAYAAGILFGLIFLTISRKLSKKSTPTNNGREHSFEKTIISDSEKKNQLVSNYLLMSVFGIILYLVTTVPPNHIIDWIHVPFPPFADAAWGFIGFAAYMYSIGLFFSTVAISQDTRLRKAIHKLATEEAGMLEKLGATRMKEELEKKVAKISREQEEVLREQTGVEQVMSEQEMIQYTEEVIKEIQKNSAKKQQQ